MNRKIVASLFTVMSCASLVLLTGCGGGGSSSSKTVSISATSGSGQTAAVSTAFGAPLVATVTTGGNPTSGVSVTFTAPGSGASGTFSNGTATETDTTDSNGVATSTTFKANATAGSYSVTAAASGASSPASFSLTNSSSGKTLAFSFYLSGQEAINSGPNYYALAGAIRVDTSGNVVGGEQDYNDASGLTSPQPSGDAITGGTLTISSTTGQGTLTLITNNANLGVSGTETLGVQFVNANHAQIMQFDGSAASSGSMDLQTLTAPSGSFAFTLSGVDTNYNPLSLGGVFTLNPGLSGIADVNDSGAISPGLTFTASLTTADSFGRGQITGTNIGGFSPAINYYIVGPEAIRIIDVDASDAAIGSAFGQGTTPFTNLSLGGSVFGVSGNPFSSQFGAIGQFAVAISPTTANFAGVGEDNELGNGVSAGPAQAISGTFSISNAVNSVTYNGYGNFTITSGLGDVNSLGIYMVDPNLNLNDPNNTSGGGGALLLDMDASLAGGTGFAVPQTDTATASFAGNYAAGWQNFNNFTTCSLCEFDMVAQGSMAAGGALSLTGLVSDPFSTLGTPDITSSGDTFSGTPLADTTNAGRYSMLSTNSTPNPLAATIDGLTGSFDLVMYQASGGALFWLEFDPGGVFFGPLQQQGSLTAVPATKRVVVKNMKKR